MKRIAIVLCLMAFFGCVHGSKDHEAALIAPGSLTVEYLKEPLGIDCTAPRLSWKLSAAFANARNLQQTAYHILVASSMEKLDRDEGDLWDSGCVKSDQSVNVVYNGTPLKSSRRCYWKVRSWDNTGNIPSAWSATGLWIMGIMRPEDWQAKWIGSNAATRPDFDLAGAKWIRAWNSGKSSGKSYFLKVFDAPQNAPDELVVLAVAAYGHSYELFINGQSAAKTQLTEVCNVHSPRQMRFFDVSRLIRPGRNVIAAEVDMEQRTKTATNHLHIVRNVIAGEVDKEQNGAAQLLTVLKFPDGTAVPTDGSWAVASKVKYGWQEKADMSMSPDWKEAIVEGDPDSQPWGKVERHIETVTPAFGKQFTVTKKVREATLHITGLGYYEASLNGIRIGNKVMDPVPTRFDKRVLYSTYDLTRTLKKGMNRLNVLLGHGLYDVRTTEIVGWDTAPWRDFPRMIAQLEIVYADGTREMVVSDSTWRQVANPVSFDCYYGGEMIGMQPSRAPDLAKMELMAEVVPAPAGRLTAEALPPSVVTEVIRPVKVREVKPGVYTADFGKNLAGWVRLTLKGQKAGNIIRIRYSELLAADGTVDQLRATAYSGYRASFFVYQGGLNQIDYFTCDGSEEQVFEPRFTSSGFQYAEISGLKEAPSASDLVACAVRTNFYNAGSFMCSNELVNKIQQAVLQTYQSNFVNGFPSDNPDRGKKGWTGDGLAAAEQAMYNFQNTAAYGKWIGDMIDEQQPDGNLPAFIPTPGWGYEWGNGPSWNSALLSIPWMLYVYQGDLRVLEKAYTSMARYVDFMTSRWSKDGLVSYGLGDWMPVKSVTPVEVTSTGHYYIDAQIIARTAELLGKTEDAKKYTELAATIRKAFNKRLYKGDGIYSIGSQTSQSCALHQGLVPANERAKTEAGLIDAVQKTNGYPDFGILGSKWVFRALSEAGRSDLAYTMASREEFPSFGYWIRQGATTFWEGWTGKGIQCHNHPAFCDVSTWFYQYLGGIRLEDGVWTTDKIGPDVVAFKRFIICPDPVEGLGWVKADYDSPYGMICSSWKKENGEFTLEVEVPVNTSATVYLPVKPDAKNVSTNVNPVPSDRDRMAFRVGSGRYTFVVH